MRMLMFAVIFAAIPGLSASPVVQVEAKGPGSVSAKFLPSRDAFTASLLFKPEYLVPATTVNGMLLRLGSGYYDGFRFSMAGDHRIGGFYPSFEIGKGQKSAKLDGLGALMKPGFWQRLTGTWDGSVMRLYLNGREVAKMNHRGSFVKPRNGSTDLVAADTRQLYGLHAQPVLVGSMSAWDRVLSAEEIASLPMKGSADNTPELPGFLRRVDCGGKVTAAEITAWREKHVVSEMSSMKLDEALAYAHLQDGDYAKAAEYARIAETKMAKNRDSKVTMKLFREKFVEAAATAGFIAEILPQYRKDYEEAKREAKPYWPYAALRLMSALRKTGAAAEVAKLEKEILAADLSVYPHLKEMFGKAYQATASGQKGATVSRAVPRKAFFVSPDGSDSAPGDERRPFATLTRARDAVRAFVKTQGLPAGGVVVYLRGGVYNVSAPLELSAADSGRTDSPVVWRAWGDEKPVLTGAFKVPKLRKVTDPAALARMHPSARGNVFFADLRAAGCTVYTNALPHYGYYLKKIPAVTELYENGRRLDPARYPDKGYLKTVTTQSFDTVKVDIPDLDRWAAEPDLAGTGFWRWLWADLTTKVLKIDPKAGTMTIDLNVEGRKLGYAAPLPNRPFFLLNALYAISRPGEWYLERSTGILYVWPTEKPAWWRFKRADYRIGAHDGAFLRMTGVSNVRIEGLVFEYGARTGVEMKNCRDCVFAGNVVRNFGGNGMNAHDCTDFTVEGNVFRTFGHGALEFSGGDRKTLTSSRSVITGNEFSDVENRRRTYAPHLHLAGVGTEVSFNHFHDAPSSAMRLEGNDFYVVSNLVEDVVLESDDQGGVDIYYNASYFGNRYCWNVWRNIGRHNDSAICGQAGVRFDGNISGQTVYANRFINCGTGHFGAIQSCGGRLHVIDNNIFDACSRGMSISHYRLDYWTGKIKKSLIRPCLQEVCITNPPFSTRYPGIKDLLATNQVNHFMRNITVGVTPLLFKPPDATSVFGNRHYGETPDMGKLTKEGYFAPVPTADDVGPRGCEMYRRAKRNDGDGPR